MFENLQKAFKKFDDFCCDFRFRAVQKLESKWKKAQEKPPRGPRKCRKGQAATPSGGARTAGNSKNAFSGISSSNIFDISTS